MTEVDAVLPEGVALPNATTATNSLAEDAISEPTTTTTIAIATNTTTTTAASTETTTAETTSSGSKVISANSETSEKSTASTKVSISDDESISKNNEIADKPQVEADKLEHVDIGKPAVESTDEQMEVDDIDTEEDDSQITTSTENKTETPTLDEDAASAAKESTTLSSIETSCDTAEEEEEENKHITKETSTAAVAVVKPSKSPEPEVSSHLNETSVNDGICSSSDITDNSTSKTSEESLAAEKDPSAAAGKSLPMDTDDGDESCLSDIQQQPEQTSKCTSKTELPPASTSVAALAAIPVVTTTATITAIKNAEETVGDDVDGETVSQDSNASNGHHQRNHNLLALDSDDDKPQDMLDPLAKDRSDDVETAEQAAKAVLVNNNKENGISSSSGTDADGIVDLDDSDDEDEDMIELNQTKMLKSALNNKNANGAATEEAKKRAVSSDDAVVIGSDSDTENEGGRDRAIIISTTNKHITISNAAPPPPLTLPIPRPVQDDDDDDDCVVIEDDTPAPIPDTNKRKLDGLVDDVPPNKRQRSLTPGNIGQLTIKDARTLMPQDAMAAKKENTIFPVTITSSNPNMPAISPIGPPKLVPMSNNTLLTTPSLTITGLSTTINNANLLPGLTDDMFVLEAPSFIVPYIYEKPPSDNIKNIIKEIETKCELTQEDLDEVDKSDEFDMITEQNKEDKPEPALTAGAATAATSKKKKKRGSDDNDDSWSEQSDDDDDDDDDDSDSGVRTKVLIKEVNDDVTALRGALKPIATVPQSGANNGINKPGQENYFESPLGKFFMDIGAGLVQEYVQADLLRLQKRKLRKSIGRSFTDFEKPIAALSSNLEASRKKNAPFKFTMKRCEFCNFKSESALSMANHYETPHMNGVQYRCNFCPFEIRNATEIVYHMEAVHNIKARLIKPLPYHQCPNCGFEDNGKAKLARHQPVCAKKFRPELNLAPPNDWEAPAKIPRIKPRHGLVGTATAYQAMAAQAAAQKAALASIQAQQQQVAQARNMQAAALAAQNAAKLRARAPVVPKPVQNPPCMMRGVNQPVRNPMATNVVLTNNYQLAANQLVQQPTTNVMSKKPVTGQPSISITPLPRQNAVATPSVAVTPSTSKLPPAGIKPGQSPSSNNSKAQFVICEICDGYIKDLEQLRNHMQWMHKVKIHPKMIYNRPPLNCQKCQFRFFTDQGLERHLLGSHGLVTSSMQEAANKGKDAGRCPVCGRMYQWKLLNHVSRDHHMTLKPAHLSYKCTVCTATFGMYKQFETHVYTAHSTVAKKAMDSKKNNGGGPAAGPSSSSHQRNNIGTNDLLLKPLKINDEITIIPQPASKPRITNMESHVID